jgi:hypothetical protein
MSENAVIEKSCGEPQLLPSEPDSQWSPEQLGTYAQAQYRQILDSETLLSRPYWRLGHVLDVAKESFGHGQWEQYLKSLGIDPTRASKARAIYRRFDNEDDVAHLTVEEAYAQRRKWQSAAPPAEPKVVASKKNVQGLRKSIAKIAGRAGTAIQDAAYASPDEAIILIPAVRKAIDELTTLLTFLEQQAGQSKIAKENAAD